MTMAKPASQNTIRRVLFATVASLIFYVALSDAHDPSKVLENADPSHPVGLQRIARGLDNAHIQNGNVAEKQNLEDQVVNVVKNTRGRALRTRGYKSNGSLSRSLTSSKGNSGSSGKGNSGTSGKGNSGTSGKGNSGTSGKGNSGTSGKGKGSTSEDDHEYADASNFEIQPRALTAFGDLVNFKSVNDHSLGPGIPMFWYIPKAGGATVTINMINCMRLATACQGLPGGHAQETDLAVVPASPTSLYRVVNVDVSTLDGIENAKTRGIAQSSIVEAVASPHIYPASDLFSQERKGQLFAIFRHPVERAMSVFHDLKLAAAAAAAADGSSSKPEFQNWSLLDYALSEYREDNWMTRQLSNQMTGDLSSAHLEVALEVLRNKFLIGLEIELDESMIRFEKYFGWTRSGVCQDDFDLERYDEDTMGSNERIEPGDEAWEELTKLNHLDMLVYKEAKRLFTEQAVWFHPPAGLSQSPL